MFITQKHIDGLYREIYELNSRMLRLEDAISVGGLVVGDDVWYGYTKCRINSINDNRTAIIEPIIGSYPIGEFPKEVPIESLRKI